MHFLQQCHKGAPFLFFNGNTFADVGRRLIAALFAELPSARMRTLTSAVAHFVAGVLDWDSMANIMLAMMESAEFQLGNHVTTLKGTLSGIVSQVLSDGRIKWRPTGTAGDLISLPETLRRSNQYP